MQYALLWCAGFKATKEPILIRSRLGTRYYDPEIRRFISADSYISTGQGILGYNMYAYCNNNPVLYVGPTGEFPWHLVIGGVTGGIAGGVSARLGGGDILDVVFGFAS